MAENDMKYKANIRIPTTQYAFLEVQVEGTPDFICESYHEFTNLMKVGAGLDPKAYDTFIQKQLLGEPNHWDEYNLMNPEQQKMVHIIRRALKRINYKNQKED